VLDRAIMLVKVNKMIGEHTMSITAYLLDCVVYFNCSLRETEIMYLLVILSRCTGAQARAVFSAYGL